jgi:hypothetical protein
MVFSEAMLEPKLFVICQSSVMTRCGLEGTTMRIKLPTSEELANMDIEDLVKLIADQIGDEREARKLAKKVKKEVKSNKPPKSAIIEIQTKETLISADLKRDMIRIRPDVMSLIGIEE